MDVKTYREYGTKPIRYRTLSPSELLHSDKRAHFASFSVDLVGVVSHLKNGNYHIDLQASGKGSDYYVLCMSSNGLGRPVLDAIKNIIVMNNETSGNTLLSVYASKEPKRKILHEAGAPVLYASMDADGDAKLHYKLSGLQYFDQIGNRTRNTTSLNIYYLSPFYYTDKNGERTQITTNIVLSDMSIARSKAAKELGKMLRNGGDPESEYKQMNLENF